MADTLLLVRSSSSLSTEPVLQGRAWVCGVVGKNAKAQTCMMRHVHTSKAALHTSVVYIAHAGAVFATVLTMPERSSS